MRQIGSCYISDLHPGTLFSWQNNLFRVSDEADEQGNRMVHRIASWWEHGRGIYAQWVYNKEQHAAEKWNPCCPVDLDLRRTPETR